MVEINISGLTKSLFNRPFPSNAGGKRTEVYPKGIRPLCQSHCLAVKCYGAVAPLVAILFFPGRPFNISGKVPKVVVNAINRVFRRRSGADMFIKCGERFKPFIAYGYASSSVMMKPIIFRVSATVFHVQPRAVFRVVNPFEVNVVESIPFVTSASAALAKTFSQVASLTYRLVPAIAAAFPAGASAFVICDATNYCEPSKYLSGKINELRHDVTSWLKVVVEKVCWKAVNQFPLFGSYPIQHMAY